MIHHCHLLAFLMRRGILHRIPHPWDYIVLGAIVLIVLLNLTKNERGKYIFADVLKIIVGLCLLWGIFCLLIWMMSGFA